MTAAVALPAAAQWRRLSPRMLLVHPVVEVARAAPALAGLFFAGDSHGSGAQWSLLGAAVVAVLSLTRWFTTRFRVTRAQIELRHGLVRRRTVTAPLDRVRTVDVTAHPLHRVLGLARVVVGTGTSDRKGRGGLVLDGLATHAALGLRAELLHRPSGSAAEASAVVESPVVALDPAWIRYAPFTMSGAITGLTLLGFGWRVVNEDQIDLGRIGPLRALAHLARRTSPAVDVIAVTAGVIAFVALASTVGYVLAFWNFRLSRHSGGSIQVTRGLLTTRATSIERRRLVGAEVSEPLLLRAVGGARCLAIATGLRVGRGAERGGELLSPPAPRTVAVGVAGAVLGDEAPCTADLTRHGPTARRRRYVRAFGASVLVATIVGTLWATVGLPGYAWLLPLLLLAAAGPIAADRYRSLGHGLTHGYFVTSYGSLVRRRSVLARESIIGWNLRSTFFQRRAGLTTLVATTAAGRQAYRSYDLDTSAAVGLAAAATPGLLTPFARQAFRPRHAAVAASGGPGPFRDARVTTPTPPSS